MRKKSEKPTMVKCKHCGAEISVTAKTCPSCGGKNGKPFYKRVWFIVLCIIVVLLIAGNAIGGNDSTSSSDSKAKTEQSSKSKSKSKPKIEYTSYDVATLNSDLESNAASASDKYKGKNVSLTGKLSNIDSDGAYISITDPGDEWDITGVSCYIKNDEQLAKVKTLNTGDTITVKGKITDVGEVLGYSLDIDSIA